MRARDILLALLIIAAGLAITAHHQGVFRDFAQAGRDVADTVAAVCGQFDGGEWRELERFSRQVPGAGATSLVIEDPNGQVTVIGQAQDDVKVEAVHYGMGTTDKAQRSRLETSRADGEVMIKVIGPQGRVFRRGSRFDLRVTAPADLDLTVTVASGPVHVRDMTKDVQVTGASGGISITGAARVKVVSASGDVELRAIRGPVEARVVSGSLTMEDVSGDVTASAISGDVRLRDLRAAVTASSVSGSLNLERFAGPQAALRSTSGDLDVTFAAPLTGRLAARTISGDVSVAVPKGSDCAVELQSVSGDIGIQLPLRETVHERGHVSGLLGAGRGRLELRSVSGSVEVKAAPEGAQVD